MHHLERWQTIYIFVDMLNWHAPMSHILFGCQNIPKVLTSRDTKILRTPDLRSWHVDLGIPFSLMCGIKLLHSAHIIACERYITLQYLILN